MATVSVLTLFLYLLATLVLMCLVALLSFLLADRTPKQETAPPPPPRRWMRDETATVPYREEDLWVFPSTWTGRQIAEWLNIKDGQ